MSMFVGCVKLCLSLTGGALYLLVVSNYVGRSLQCHWRSSLFVGCQTMLVTHLVPLEDHSEKVSCWTELILEPSLKNKHTAEIICMVIKNWFLLLHM